MKKIARFVSCGVSLLLLTPYLRAEEQPAFIQFVRPLGMGGAFTAIADDQNIFSYNPAGMVQRTGAQVTLLEIALGGSQDLKDAYDFVSDNEDKLTNFENLSTQEQIDLINKIDRDISKLNPRAYLAADIASYVSGPRFLGLPLHVGFGAFGVVDANFKLDSSVLVPNISYSINNDLVFPLSVAHRWEDPWFIPGKLGVGFTGKIIRRNQIEQERLSVLQLDSLDSPPMVTGAGVGSDLGFLYQPTDRLNLGLMIQDFMGTKIKFDSLAAEDGFPAQPGRTSVIRPRTNVGVAVTPEKLFWLVPTKERWTFAADIRDIRPGTNEHVLFENGLRKPFGTNLPTHTYLGAEFKYWFLRFRGGAYQGYPTFGLGVDIPFLKIDYAFYSRELGFRSGDIQEENHVISLAVRFGSGSTESRERIRRAKGDTKMKEEVAPDTTSSVPATDEVTPAPSNGETPANP